nr:SDR family oxidoreductase [uncultured Blautia sp.]
MKTMVITGTTQGIGNALYKFYQDKYKIITINRREFEGNNYICDLSEIQGIKKAAQKLSRVPVDIMINNAGGAEPKVFSELTAEELIKCSNLNYHAPVLLMQAVLEGMRQRHSGRIVNVSSIASKSPRALIPHYGAAKSALEKFSASMAVAYSDCGIAINCICPGGINTETSLKNRKKMANISGRDENYYNDMMASGNGLGRMVDVHEVVELIDFLISDKATAISGQTYNICGIKEVH